MPKSRWRFLLAFFLASAANAASLPSGCVDYLGRPVKTVEDTNLPAIPGATMIAGSPVILLNPKRMAEFSEPMRTFVYWHECGHHAFAHLRGTITMGEEQEADCFGIRVPLTLGKFTHANLSAIQNDLSALVGDPKHLPGPTRAINIELCLGEGFEKENWDECKTRFYANVDSIENAVPEIKKLTAVCKIHSGESLECAEARSSAAELKQKILRSVTRTDTHCPYVMDPQAMTALTNFNRAMLGLSP